MAYRHGTPPPFELIIWEMAEHFHWTLDYVEGLSIARLHEWEKIKDARAKVRGDGRKNS